MTSVISPININYEKISITDNRNPLVYCELCTEDKTNC